MRDVPHLKQDIFKGVCSLLVPDCGQLLAGGVGPMCHVTLQGLCHAMRKEAWKFLLGYFPWDSTLEERKVLQRVKT